MRMLRYRTYSILAGAASAQIIEASSSFEARKAYTAQHADKGCELSDVVAIRIREGDE
ncbi:hypothetical protein [Bradyrhizobium sp. SZCCHNRI2049]|uniref:hypothetical protein n=1 Tax=Bradyrhizobium sp. SZCCHNRI2049 TaxID=3057287 RepID=UPI0029166FFD|nr:hypothetical protein [Bradyrhizobium sp. SZCCHNRI2049]